MEDLNGMKFSNFYEIALKYPNIDSVFTEMFHIHRTHKLGSHVLAEKYNSLVFICQDFLAEIPQG